MDINLGSIIQNAKARKIIYSAYALVVLTVGAFQAAYAAIGAQPEWLLVVLAVVAYLGVPVGGLAAANASNTVLAEPDTIVEAVEDEPAADVVELDEP